MKRGLLALTAALLNDDGALLFYGLGGELRENCEPHCAERFHHGSPIRSRWRLYGPIRHRASKHAGVLPRSSNADTHLRLLYQD